MTRSARHLVLGALAAAGAALVVDSRQRGYDEPLERPYGPMADPVAERAAYELSRWRGLTETDPRAAPLLAEYWRSAGMDPQDPSVPWSAAFISHVAGGALTPSGSHVAYARAGYQARGKPGLYWTLTPAEAGRVRSGDLLLRGRSSPALTFADLREAGGFIPSHADVVLTADDHVATAVGGNKRNSVAIENYPLSAGCIGSPVVAVLRRGGVPPLSA